MDAEQIAFLLAALCFGILIGLIIGPDIERNNIRYIDGWLAGYKHRSEEMESRND